MWSLTAVSALDLAVTSTITCKERCCARFDHRNRGGALGHVSLIIDLVEPGGTS